MDSTLALGFEIICFELNLASPSILVRFGVGGARFGIAQHVSMKGSTGCWEAARGEGGDWEFGEGHDPVVCDLLGILWTCFALAGRSELFLLCSSSRPSNPGYNVPGLQPA